MNRFLKTAVLGTAVAASTLTALSAAYAGDGWRRHYRDYDRPRYEYRHRNNGGDALAAGVLGLAAGALIVGALNNQRAPDPDYYDPPLRRSPMERPAPVRNYYPVAPEPGYSGGYANYRPSIEPWTPEWYAYCQDRYRSFQPRSGTFTGYDGQQHFCVAN
ncbi:BA14K family protein [Corticibacterium sp. UT-5YL-CI-8]|nr:BA14K family protein [Tianweitania sp. UT-5YL-CI-8]